MGLGAGAESPIGQLGAEMSQHHEQSVVQNMQEHGWNDAAGTIANPSQDQPEKGAWQESPFRQYVGCNDVKQAKQEACDENRFPW